MNTLFIYNFGFLLDILQAKFETIVYVIILMFKNTMRRALSISIENHKINSLW